MKTLQVLRGLDFELIGWALALVALIVGGAILVIKVKRWREEAPEQLLSAEEQLEHYRQLMETGDLDAAEYERIRSALEKKQPPS